ncbi:2-amino-4-hydroxy-6-hydroxymethyldihydropteridine diphosphokinase [Blochmannia endosymbiont of Polyrhachis (Hedomyrma) turneri]|uniref:2-amino-4-hydroxy-6- hydroxymethyldihydropteridine diphosphokinase n=1 Tax=Blochmannia endosymbiont of Polyrhachis (Hedomyrma) turneri TaxID=1505596 RepID=UPI00061A84A7|nr:2-amino-4-hydroxy-6-hydroxymethyldihydropteridine diphosphokinase [Blochmannia endosymbiont of Polyrhachis (Hedomyrma) turneri]AKC59733.1 2-amino-4-hydroxy-6-hydroxymethyldihydropteridine pyrophosphokinase [Blochmannia endosymbiont of Polyrhachis (Hedomyrma) turneri]
MERVVIGIGSNLLGPLQQIKKSLCTMKKDYANDIRLIACSSYYRSRPLGGMKQPDFLNVVVIIETRLSPIGLLNCLQLIEAQQGRVRSGNFLRWGPRTLDIDILLFGNRIVITPRLIIPHYDMLNRAFVLCPLLELLPDFCFLNGRMLSEYLHILRTDNNYLRRLDIS